MANLDESADGGSVTLRSGETLMLTLPETPTTGFRWRILADAAPVLSLQEDRSETAGARPGAPGMHHWVWRAAAIGQATLHLETYRSWGEAQGSRQFRLAVQVG